jgi:hypothetical protein
MITWAEALFVFATAIWILCTVALAISILYEAAMWVWRKVR